MSFTPRQYQTDTVAAVNGFWEAGKRFPLVIAPTGAGKTETAKMILAPYRAPMAIVHTMTLFQQTMRRCPDVRVYTLQSLIAKGVKADARRQGLARHDCAWFDEAHHVGGEDWQAVLDIPWLPKRRFGVTATPMRVDGTALGDIFDCFHVAAQYSQLVAGGYLCRCDVHRPEVSRKDQKKLKVRPDGVALYLEHARVQLEDPRFGSMTWRPGIHFETTIEQCEEASQRYIEAGVRSAVISSRTLPEERARLFEAYSRGELDMLCSPTVLAEGFDSPRAEVCVLRRMVDHVGDFLQRVGRVLRPFPGKQRALLIDCCNATTKKTHGLPTDDRVYSLTGKGIQSVEEAQEAKPVLLEEEETPEKIEWRAVQVKSQMVRDTLLSRYRDIVATAAENNYRPGWVFHRFAQVTSLSIPMRFASKYQSVCPVCRKRHKVGDEIFWLKGDGGPAKWNTTLGTPGDAGSIPLSGALHPECWVQALDEGALSLASAALEHEDSWKPRGSFAHDLGDDDIPF